MQYTLEVINTFQICPLLLLYCLCYICFSLLPGCLQSQLLDKCFQYHINELQPHKSQAMFMDVIACDPDIDSICKISIVCCEDHASLDQFSQYRANNFHNICLLLNKIYLSCWAALVLKHDILNITTITLGRTSHVQHQWKKYMYSFAKNVTSMLCSSRSTGHYAMVPGKVCRYL